MCIRDSTEDARESEYAKSELKAMIERKRRNDFVRKREFDMLRKMRKREAMVGVGQDPAGRPSFFQSSMPSKPDDRATTLKKIDEIEAQMSMQWWKTKNGGMPDNSVHAPLHSPSTQAPPMLDNALPTAYRATAPAGLQQLNAARLAAEQQAAREAAHEPSQTQPDSLSVALAAARSAPPPQPPAKPVSYTHLTLPTKRIV